MKARAVAIATLLGVYAAAAASSCAASEYKTFVFAKGIAHFEFEYPASYRESSGYAVVEKGTYGVYFIRTKPRVPSGAFYPHFEVLIESATLDSPDARALMERELSQLDESDLLLERSTTRVAGIPAGLIAYVHQPYLTGSASPTPPVSVKPSSAWGVALAAAPSGTETRVTRKVFFDHKGLIWTITIDTEEGEADQAKTDFDHILQTLQILD